MSDRLLKVLPRAETLCLCIALRAGTLMIGVFGVIYSVFHVYFITVIYQDGSIHEESKISVVLRVFTSIMNISDIYFGLFSIYLIYVVVKEKCKKLKLWIFAAVQNAIITFLFELLASPLFFLGDSDDLKETANVLPHWKITIIFSVLPLLWFYFIIVVTSYFEECVNTFRPRSYSHGNTTTSH